MMLAKGNSVIATQQTPLDDLRDLLSDDLQKVDKLIFDLVEGKAPLIPDISNHTISAGGKRLRPLLTLACSRMCGIKSDCHIELATSVEFFHTATLLHDDVVDQSELRRGLSCASRLWGDKESILVGDFLLGKAFSLMHRAGSLRVYKILSDAAVIISEGEVLQLMNTGDISVGEKEYLEVISAKTAALFSAACEIGAVMAGTSDVMASALRQFGLNLGVVFQVVDDVLDYAADRELTGKNIGDDFRERKVTLPVIYAYQRGGEEEKEFWHRTMSGDQPLTDDEVSQAVALVNKGDVLIDVMAKANQFAVPARESLGLFPDSPLKKALLGIVDFVIERTH